MACQLGQRPLFSFWAATDRAVHRFVHNIYICIYIYYIILQHNHILQYIAAIIMCTISPSSPWIPLFRFSEARTPRCNADRRTCASEKLWRSTSWRKGNLDPQSLIKDTIICWNCIIILVHFMQIIQISISLNISLNILVVSWKHIDDLQNNFWR